MKANNQEISEEVRQQKIQEARDLYYFIQDMGYNVCSKEQELDTRRLEVRLAVMVSSINKIRVLLHSVKPDLSVLYSDKSFTAGDVEKEFKELVALERVRYARKLFTDLREGVQYYDSIEKTEDLIRNNLFLAKASYSALDITNTKNSEEMEAELNAALEKTRKNIDNAQQAGSFTTRIKSEAGGKQSGLDV